MAEFYGMGALTRDPTPDYGAPIAQGLQLGMRLAESQQQLEIRREQLAAQKQQLKEQSFDRAMQNIVRAANVKNPQARKFLLTNSTELLQRTGYTVDPNALNEMVSNPDYSTYLAQFLNAPEQIRSNPVLAQQVANAFSNLETQSGEFQAFKSVLDGLYKSEAASAQATGALQRTQLSETQKALTAGFPADLVQDLLGLNGPDAQAKAQKDERVQRLQEAAVKQREAKATGTDAQLIQAGAAEKRADIAETDSQTRAQAAKDLADYRRGMLKVAQQRLANQKDKGGTKEEKDLRKELLGQKSAKEMQEVAAAYQKVQSSVQNVSPAGDLSIIFNYMKMLDPGSVVREGEFATAQNATGVPDRVRNYYNRMIKGERLNPAQRSDFLAQAKNQYNAQLQAYSDFSSNYIRLAREKGLKPENVVLSFPGYKIPESLQGDAKGGNKKGDSTNAPVGSAIITQLRGAPKFSGIKDKAAQNKAIQEYLRSSGRSFNERDF